jgi:hypothetical protein
MFKRRLAVLGAVAVLAITGLAGSAMADETPAPAGTKVTCTTADGKTVELAEPLPGKGSMKGGVVITRDGKMTRIKPGTEPSETIRIDALPEGEVPEAVKVAPIPEGDLEAVPAMPAEPFENGAIGDGVKLPDGPGQKVHIICKKPE